jgi:hypothetical protein
VLLNKRDRPCPDLAGGQQEAARLVQREAGPGNGSADGRRQAADRRQETGGRQVAGGSLWHSTQALLRGVRRAPGCIVWLPVCLHLSTYTLCPRGRRTQAGSSRQRPRRQHTSQVQAEVFLVSSCYQPSWYTTYVDRRSRRSRARRAVGGAGADVDADADVFMAPPPGTSHAGAGALPWCQPAIPASILIRFAHRQLANSHPEPRVTCNEGHPPPLAVCRLRC